MRRNDIASTSVRRHVDVVCLLGFRFFEFLHNIRSQNNTNVTRLDVRFSFLRNQIQSILDIPNTDISLIFNFYFNSRYLKNMGDGRVMRWCCVNFQYIGVLLLWIKVGQGPTALAVDAGGGCLDIFSLVYHFSFPSPSLRETARYRLKYCLKVQNNHQLTKRSDISKKIFWFPEC